MQAMILAAGFGTRLKPFSEIKPKPLFPVVNQPILLHTIEKLKAGGFQKIIVNCHHLADQIIEVVSSVPEVIVQYEEIILGTGGGLRRALEKLDDSPLVIVNGDIYHSVSYRQLLNTHIESGKPVTMALHDLSRFNKVNVDGDRVVGIGQDTTEKLAFTGIHVVRPEILEAIPQNSFSCIIERYRELLQAGGEIGSYRTDHCFWSDMGTVPDYLNLHAVLLAEKNKVPCKSEENRRIICGENTCLPDNISIEDWACLGSNVQIGENVQLKRCVVWDNAVLESNKQYHDAIIV